ncbi:hypothetical protein SNEBB_003794 [Seison nebaliae]|nr:hypothetical protein SNEBB_003794 [Seison nebaliae]
MFSQTEHMHKGGQNVCIYKTSEDLIRGYIPTDTDDGKPIIRNLLLNRQIIFDLDSTDDEKEVKRIINKHLEKLNTLCYGEPTDGYVQYTPRKKNGLVTYPLIPYKYSDARGWYYGRYGQEMKDFKKTFKSLKNSKKRNLTQMSFDDKIHAFLHHELKILKHNLYLSLTTAFTTIFQKHNITHFLHQGTLIGALRHHDFIPWDDDIDIVAINDKPYKFIEALMELVKTRKIRVTTGRIIEFRENSISSYYEGTPFNANSSILQHFNPLNLNFTSELEREKEMFRNGRLNEEYPVRNTTKPVAVYSQLKISFNRFILSPLLKLKISYGYHIETSYYSYPTIDLWISYPQVNSKDYTLFNFKGKCDQTRKRPGRVHRTVIHPIVYRPFGPIWLPTPNDPVLYLRSCSKSQQLFELLFTCQTSRVRHEFFGIYKIASLSCEYFKEFFPFVEFDTTAASVPSKIWECYYSLSLYQANAYAKRLTKTFYNLEKAKAEVTDLRFRELLLGHSRNQNVSWNYINYDFTNNTIPILLKNCVETLKFNEQIVQKVLLKFG